LNILLVRLREIGDVVFTTPALRAVRQRFPDAHIAYLVEPLAAPIVASNPHLDELIIAPRASLAADVRLGLRLRARRFDLAVDFHGGPRASLLVWLSRAPRRIGYAVPGRAWMYTTPVARPLELRPRHAVENQWDLLTPIGVPAPSTDANPVEMPTDPRAAATLNGRLQDAGLPSTDRLIVVHVSAGNPFRRWPQGAFAELVAALASRHADVRVIVVSGPSEREAAAHVVELAQAELAPAHRDRVLTIDDCSLAELRALFDRSALFIGGDSGPLHIAATSHVPIVGLYGPTLPVRSAPWRSRLLTTESVDGGDLECRPCNQRVCVPGDFRCLTWIGSSTVVAAAERVLAADASGDRQ
jgi:ADP-heptose:LPS heptosyltransferase